MSPGSPAPASRRREGSSARPKRGRIPFACFAALAAVCFAALGVWQVERRSWKLDLVARVDARVAAPALPIPPPERWASVSRENDEYRHVRAEGRFERDRSVLVRALTREGSGFWLVSPLATADRGTVLVNRGFVPPGWSEPADDGAPVAVTGLLRMSEPANLLFRNDPAAGSWATRDVPAIARSLGLSDAAPFFVDADGSANAPGRPVGGLTVVEFRNHHLVYALTWFALAAMSGAGLWRILYERTPR